MHIRAQSLITGTASLLFSGAAFADEKTFDLSGFEGVSVSSGVTAEISVGSDYSVRAESTAEGLDRLKVELKNGDLHIGRKNIGFRWRDRDQVTVYVTLPLLKSLDASSGSSANASGVAGGPFSLDASSGADASVAGVCDVLSLDVSTGATIEASDLVCKSANADASTGASAKIHASESIVAEASTGASIRVYGEPKNVNTDTSTGGNVKIMN